MPERLRPHKEKKPGRRSYPRFASFPELKFRAYQAVYDPKGLKSDIGHGIVDNEKPIKRLLLKIAIAGAVLLLLGFLADLFLSTVTVYVGGEPVLGPGAK